MTNSAIEISALIQTAFVTLITDVKAGETDILTPVQTEDLLFRDLDNNLLFVTACREGEVWSHESLCAVSDMLSEIGLFDGKVGVNAFLGVTWIGSTEI